MAKFIRQGATHKVVIGPFVDVTDGFTPETGITLGAADEAEAILHDNGTVVDISGYTWAAITTADGYYHLTLQSGISNTVGHLTVIVHDDSVCLPVREDFIVVEEAVYDMLFASSATGYIANASVNVAQFGGVNGTFASGRPEVNTTHWAGTAVGSATVSANVTQISGDSTAADNLENAFDDTAGPVAHMGIIDQGQAQSATGTTLVLRSAAAFASDELIGATVVITGGTGIGQSRVITDYDGGTDTATVDTWTTTPSGTILYKIYATPPASGLNDIADAILDRNMGSGTDSGSATVRTVRQALRPMRNKWSISTGTLTVYKEDDSTASWSSTLTTDGNAEAVTSSDPASS